MDCEATVRILLERMVHDATVQPTNLPISLLKSITNNFADDQQIGSGGFAVVYKGLLQNGVVAVKKLSRSSDFDEKKFNQEVDTLMRVKHKNIVRFLGYCADTQGKMSKYEGKNVMAEERQRLLCFEFLAKGSLAQYITNTSQGLEWNMRYQIIKGICDGLHYLHTHRVLHLDLKPANILLNDSMLPKIADFGLSRCFDGNKSRTMTSNLVGTPGYAAPEFFSGVVAFELDIYSLGVIILEILTGQKGYVAVENVLESWKGRIKTSQGDAQLEQVKACAEIGIQCIHPDPARRPNTRHIIAALEEMERTSGFIGTDRHFTSSATHSMDISPAQPLQRIVSVPKGPGETRTEIHCVGSSETSKLLDIHPLELHFSFETTSKRMLCPVTLTNRTNQYVGAWITPTDDHRFPDSWDMRDPRRFLRNGYVLGSHRPYSRRGQILVSWEDACSSVFQMMEPHSTWAVTMTMMEQRHWGPWLPLGTGKFEVLMIVLRSKEHLENFKESIIGSKLIMDIECLKRVEELGGEVHRAVLTADICDPASSQQEVTLYQCRVAWSNGLDHQRKPVLEDVSCLDAHPSETRILVGHIGGYVSIWNYNTQEREIMFQVTSVHTSNGAYSVIRSAKFVSREQWFAVGDSDGWVYVYADPTEDKIKEFEAHRGESVSLLAVHSTYPFLLTSSFTDTSIKLWDWEKDWMCTRTFDVPSTGLFRLTWNPTDDSTAFAGVSYDKTVKVWESHSSDPIITFEGMENARYLYSESHDHLMVIIGCDRETNVNNSASIWDLPLQECIHRLGFSGSDIYDVACHPTLPVLATSHSSGQIVCFWDTRTFRLEKMVHLSEGHMQGMVFTGTKDITRLVAKYLVGILIIEVNMHANGGKNRPLPDRWQ